MGSGTSDSQCWYLPTNRVLHSHSYRNQALRVTITSARSVTAQEPQGTPDTVHSWYFCTRYFVRILSCSPSPRKNKPLYYKMSNLQTRVPERCRMFGIE